MPANFEIDTQAGLVRSAAWGDVTLSDLRNHQDSLLAHPEFNPQFDQLLDFREVSSANLTGGQIRTIALREVFSSSSRRAVVAPDPAIFGMARLYETHYSMLDNPAELKIFRDLQSALEWLRRESIHFNSPPRS